MEDDPGEQRRWIQAALRQQVRAEPKYVPRVEVATLANPTLRIQEAERMWGAIWNCDHPADRSAKDPAGQRLILAPLVPPIPVEVGAAPIPHLSADSLRRAAGRTRRKAPGPDG